jgi:mono/diheme cytochrome c family protein
MKAGLFTVGSRAAFPVLGLLALSVPSLPAADVDYLRDVKPIFEEHCYTCHGPAKQQAGLRLDTAALAISGGDGGPAIVPGDAAGSRLLAAVEGTSDEISQMPLDADPLTAEQIDILRHWIAAGAPHPDDELEAEAVVTSDHWSLQPVQRPPVPSVRDPARLHNEIDAFIAARLDAAGLEPSPVASHETLLRRVYLDLLGVLPTPGERSAFLADERPDAYEQLVERLLASPRYGERWARHWLDAARYADSNGFTIDGARTVWPYRDWVVGALNDDMPFDEFTIEQLAGDLLASPTQEQLIATGFHRNTLSNEEGGTDDEQFRVENVVDRVGTTSTVWLGLTVACAQCHDHKFDPIAQRDFYRLFAVFNNTADSNDAAGLAPKLELPTPRQAADRTRLTRELAAAQEQKSTLESELLAQMADWEASLAQSAEVVWTTITPESWSSKDGAEITRLDDQSLLVGGTIPLHDTYDVRFRSPLPSVTAIRLETLTHDSLPKTGPGHAPNGNFVLSEVECYLAPPDLPAADLTAFQQSLVGAVADHSQENYPIAHSLDGDIKTGWAINVKSGSINVPRTAVFMTAGAVASPSDQQWTFRLRHDTPDNKWYQIGRLRLSVTDSPVESLLLTDEVRAVLALPSADRTAEQQTQLKTFFLTGNADWRALSGTVEGLQRELKALAAATLTTLVMNELPQPRETHVLIRGDFLRPGAPVTPGVPAVLHDLPDGVTAPNRLDLARWLTDPDNPLTARVVVNRAWQRFFGVGLVETDNDFGTQGSPPTHPELLDWLAAELIREQWSLKALHRLIVTSATYRQSSETRPDLAAADPRNRLLARQARLRLEAEVIRDACLSASGVLSDKLGGPPVNPPQPEGIYVFTQNAKPWQESTGEDRYRRALYTQFWRSSPHPMLPTFDVPDANAACTRRNRSNTPLQALTLANDRGFMEFAQMLAARVLTEAPPYDDGRLRYGFGCVLGREPNDMELSTLSAYLAAQRARYIDSAEAAALLSPPSLPEGLSPADGAAWTSAARVLLNLDEFITRE